MTKPITLAQINPTVGDLEGNTNIIISYIEKARRSGSRFIVFPELAISGYPPEDLLLMPSFIDRVRGHLDAIIASSLEMTVLVGLPRSNQETGEKFLHNSVAVIENGTLLGFQDKILLPTYDVFDERRYFEPGKECRLWNLSGMHVAITVCEDIWGHTGKVRHADYLMNPVEKYVALKPDLMVNLSASPYSTGKIAMRYEVCKKTAQVLGCPLVYCNQSGGNDSLIFDGKSLVYSGKGELLQQGKGFDVDTILVNFKPQVISQADETEDLFHALVLGVKDYFSKQGFQKACFGLSGGIDSAVVACIAANALKKENLLAVLMPSRYSSKGSVDDSLKLVDTLGIAHKLISIEGPFNAFLSTLEPHFEGLKPDVTEENLQARIRGTLLMALSNKFGYVVLSTGNKSEMAMGYCTLYGDMCGGLSVLGDVTKKEIYQLARWLKIIPQEIIEKPPSAELRPNQKDSDSLPDYDVIDQVVHEHVVEHLSVEAIAKKWGYPVELVKRIVQAIHQNEYKRRQSAPVIRVSEKAFFVGRRFPIVHKGI